MARLLALFFALAIHCTAFAQTPAASGPLFSFKETVHDFGKVQQDSTLHCSFEFTNTGTAPLFITNIEPTCHCVSVNWERRPFSPGETGRIEVTYAPPIGVGRFDRGLMIASNAANYDPQLMAYELRVRGEGMDQLPAAPVKAKSTKRKAHGK